MIITLTGKPCSGKSTVAKLFCKKYNFEYYSTGALFREYASENDMDILELNRSNLINNADTIIDNRTKEIGKTRLKDDILFESRLAWYFIPDSFKVFLDVSPEEMGRRLFTSNRADSEKGSSITEATKSTLERWNLENERYRNTYNVDNLNKNNYDLIISTDNVEPEQIIKTIFDSYTKWLKSKQKL